MIHQIRKRLKRYPLPSSVVKTDRSQAAVLLPIINSDDPRLLLTERSAKLNAHGGEVAWPGGKQDESDANLQFTALRETWEEVGILPGQVEVIAQLRPFISKFGLLVTPFVGIVDQSYCLKLSHFEIASTFQLPLRYLLDDPRTETNIIERHGERHIVPVYHYEGYKVWGLTAMILLEFMRIGLGMEIEAPS